MVPGSPSSLERQDMLVHRIAIALIRSSLRTLVKATMKLRRECSPLERKKHLAVQEEELVWLEEANHWAFGVIALEPDIFGDVARAIVAGRIPLGLSSFIQEED